ncbi:SDR family oxidoreductase [soil metagenome]
MINKLEKTTVTLGTVAGAAVLAVGLMVARHAWREKRFMDLRGKQALITGGSRGLGLVLARELVAQGARVVICARDEEELARARAEFNARGEDILAVACDVTQQEDIDDLLQFIERRAGPIDILINNAGMIMAGPLDAMDTKDFEDSMNLHFWAPLKLTRAVLPAMRGRGSGRIVNIASFGGRVSVPHILPYSASKFALVGLSEGLRSELTKEGIYVTTVCPGMLRTGSHLQAEFKGQNSLEYTWFTLSNANPLLSMSAETAAKRIVVALQNGEANLTLTFAAKALEKLHAIAPETTAHLLSAMNRVLPNAAGVTERVKGKDSKNFITDSPLTAHLERAAERNNEVDAEE